MEPAMLRRPENWAELHNQRNHCGNEKSKEENGENFI